MNINNADVLFCAASFEERCISGAELLNSNGFKAKIVIMFQYEHADLISLREKCIKRLEPILKEIAIENFETIECMLYEPHIAMQN